MMMPITIKKICQDKAGSITCNTRAIKRLAYSLAYSNVSTVYRVFSAIELSRPWRRLRQLRHNYWRFYIYYIFFVS